MKGSLAKKSLISITDLSKDQIETILKATRKLEENPQPNLLKNTILANCFFEPSTRTRLSFSAAMKKLGGSVIGFSENLNISEKKGESFADTIKITSQYADIIVLRHSLEGTAKLAAEICPIPVINAGDGANQHPTQTLLDLFTIQECQGKLDDLHIALVGDLKYSRAIHSLCSALAHFSTRLYFVFLKHLEIPETSTHELKRKGVKFSFHKDLQEILPKLDVLYLCRIQKERFIEESSTLQNFCLLKKEHLKKAQKHLKILHPLPRFNEIEKSIDETSYAYYFQQAANGLKVRMALLAMILGKL